MSDIIQPIKGTRDFYPQEMALRSWLYNNIRQVSESFGYQEYEGPFLESIQLYAAKSGEELVKEQSFVFEDRSGDLVTLRPELTPTLVRMVAQRQFELVYPLRWWSFGPFWRYERPQKGRGREFFQWNIDLVGLANPEGDAELAAIAASFFKSVGLTPEDVVLQVNNRRLVDRQMTTLKIPLEKRPEVLRLIDRREKMDAEDWRAYAGDIGLDDRQFNGVEGMLEDQDLWRDFEELERFFAAVEALGVSEYVRFAPDVIRGLDYYTGTVFEAQGTKDIVKRAILGGGRYDNLMADVGGEPLPGVGFAMGDMVITLILEGFGLLPAGLDRSPAPVLVTVFDQELLLASFSLAAELRGAGIKVVCYPEGDKLGKQFKYADRIGAKIALILGPEERAANQVAVKDLFARDQQNVPRSDLAQFVRRMLESQAAS